MKSSMNGTLIIPQQDAKVIAFGDSTTDIGNLFLATGGLLPPSPPYAEGRFSNGQVAVEFLARNLGLNLNLETNFAVGGATSGRTNINDTTAVRFGGLLDQIDRFVAQVGSNGADPNALYFVWAGANDFLSLPSDPTLVGQAIGQAVTNIRTAVETLATTGAKNIVVVQNPNLGRLPLSLESDLLTPLTGVTLALNTELQNALLPLEQSRGINVVLTDLFAIGEQIAQNPSAFGFENTTDPFLNGLVPADPDANANQFFFWDRAHPTTRAHSIFAQTFRQDAINGITDDVVRIGTPQDDLLVGFSGNDFLAGLDGNDQLEGNRGRDTLRGGRGNDTLSGFQGRDLLVGDTGNDLLLGNGGNDRLFGGNGRDTLRGGLGADFLNGGRGNDTLEGGRGADRFWLQPNHGVDTILDFELGVDRIVLGGRLTFNGLNFRQRGDDTVIRITRNNQRLAILQGIQASSLSANNFLNAGNNSAFELPRSEIQLPTVSSSVAA
jgi:phospholipase/lecithinase/hemolysin